MRFNKDTMRSRHDCGLTFLILKLFQKFDIVICQIFYKSPKSFMIYEKAWDMFFALTSMKSDYIMLNNEFYETGIVYLKKKCNAATLFIRCVHKKY